MNEGGLAVGGTGFFRRYATRSRIRSLRGRSPKIRMWTSTRVCGGSLGHSIGSARTVRKTGLPSSNVLSISARFLPIRGLSTGNPRSINAACKAAVVSSTDAAKRRCTVPLSIPIAATPPPNAPAATNIQPHWQLARAAPTTQTISG